MLSAMDLERETSPAAGTFDADLLRLAVGNALAQFAERVGTSCEKQRAYRLINEVAACWPGRPDQMWWKWLIEAGRSLELDLRVADVSERDLRSVVESDTFVVTLADDGSTLVGLERSRKRGYTARRLDGKAAGESEKNAARPTEPLRRIVVDERHSALSHFEPHEHVPPLQLLFRLLQPESKDIFAVLIISSIAGLLMLSVPVTAQHLVRTVTFASLYQPIVVLSLMLLGILGFVAALTTLQTYVAEIIQRRLFVKVAGAVARRLPQTEVAAWKQHHAPELMNRFIDVVIVQKAVAALLVDGVAILLSTLIGMSVMAFYHPFLLGYDLLLLALLTGIIFGLGRGGVQSAIGESRVKYQVLAWLEDVARCPSIFQAFGAAELAAQRSDALCSAYLQQRRAHFRVLLRQIVSVLLLQAVATTSLLGLGGYLVLNEQLTLGQLVAAELIVATIVLSFAKLGKQLEGWYDLLAAVEKLSHLMELPVESRAGLVGLPRTGPGQLEIRRGGDSDRGVFVAPRGCAVLEGWDQAAYQALRETLQGGRDRAGMIVLLDGVDLADFRPDIIRAHITVLSDVEFLPASIADNVHIHRAGTTDKDVLDALDAVGVNEEFRVAGRSVADMMQPSGWPLTESQCVRLVLARGLAGHPRVLVIDRLLDGLGDDDLIALVPRLSRVLGETTLLVITDQARVAQLFAPTA